MNRIYLAGRDVVPELAVTELSSLESSGGLGAMECPTQISWGGGAPLHPCQTDIQFIPAG